MVALIAALGWAEPVHLPEPEVRTLDDQQLRRVPRFSGRGARVPMPAHLAEGYPELSPDGRYAATYDYDANRTHIRTADGRRLWSASSDDVSELRFVGEGLMTTSSYDVEERWQLREVQTGRTLASFEGYTPNVVAPAPGGERIAVEQDGRLRILDRAGSELHRWAVETIDDVQFSRDGRRVLICDNGVRLWDVEKDRIVFFERDPRWNDCAADPELTVAYLARDDGYVERLELKWDGARTAWPVSARAHDVAWVAPDVVWVATDRPYTEVLDLGKGTVLAHLEGEGRDLRVADGRLTRSDGLAVSWSWPGLEPVAKGPRQWDPSVIEAHEGVVATGDTSGSVLITEGNRLVQHLWGFGDNVTDLAFHGDWLAVGDGSGKVTVFDWRSGERVHEVQHHAWSDAHAAWSPDGGTLVVSTVSDDDPSWLDLWDTTTWTRRHRSRNQDLAQFDFASHGRWFAAAGDAYEELQLIDTATGTVLRSVPSRYRQDWTWVAVVDDQQVVAWSAGDDENQLWHPPAEPKKVESWGWPAAFSDDGRKLAADEGYDLVVYASSTGREMMREEVEGLIDLAWTPDGRTVLGLMDDGTVRRWFSGGEGPGAQSDELQDLALVDLEGVPTWTEARRIGVDRRAEHLAVAADGRIALAPVDHRAQLLSAEGESLRQVGNAYDWDDEIEHVVFAADGRLVTSDRDRITRVWKDGEEVDQRTKCEGGQLVDGAIQCAERNPERTAWDGQTLVDGKALPSQPGLPTQSALSPDGKHIAVAANELTVVWDVKKRAPIGRIDGSARHGVAWSADGRHVLTLGGEALTWWAAP